MTLHCPDSVGALTPMSEAIMRWLEATACQPGACERHILVRAAIRDARLRQNPVGIEPIQWDLSGFDRV